MSRTNQATSSQFVPSANAPAAWRVRFVQKVEPGALVIRRFDELTPMFAVAETVKLSEAAAFSPTADTADQLMVVHLPRAGASKEIDTRWLGRVDEDAPLATSIPLEDGRLHWIAGKALIEGKIASRDDALAAIAEFAFYESQLRVLEEAIAPIEAAAPDDVQRAYVPRRKDRGHWARLTDTLQRLSHLRLSSARLERRLNLSPRQLAVPERRLISRLYTRADLEARQESLSDRLEACEDLYEGAVDRITDHRWYRRGMTVEIAIVILLFLEVLQLAATMLHAGAGH